MITTVKPIGPSPHIITILFLGSWGEKTRFTLLSKFWFYQIPLLIIATMLCTGLEKVSFHSNPKERQCQIMLKQLHNFISHTNKVMLKILQARLQQYVNRELPADLDLRRGVGPAGL